MKREESPCAECDSTMTCRGTCEDWRRWFSQEWNWLQEIFLGKGATKNENENDG